MNGLHDKHNSSKKVVSRLNSVFQPGTQFIIFILITISGDTLNHFPVWILICVFSALILSGVFYLGKLFFSLAVPGNRS